MENALKSGDSLPIFCHCPSEVTGTSLCNWHKLVPNNWHRQTLPPVRISSWLQWNLWCRLRAPHECWHGVNTLTTVFLVLCFWYLRNGITTDIVPSETWTFSPIRVLFRTIKNTMPEWSWASYQRRFVSNEGRMYAVFMVSLILGCLRFRDPRFEDTSTHAYLVSVPHCACAVPLIHCHSQAKRNCVPLKKARAPMNGLWCLLTTVWLYGANKTVCPLYH